MIDPNTPPSFMRPPTYTPHMLVDSENKKLSPDGQIRANLESKSVDNSGEVSDSAWAKMFPAGASKEELKAFIQIYVQDLMREIRRSDKIHKEHMAEQKRQQDIAR